MAQTFWPMIPTPKRPLFTLVCILATKGSHITPQVPPSPGPRPELERDRLRTLPIPDMTDPRAVTALAMRRFSGATLPWGASGTKSNV
eukprot:5570650-Prymnesium_polylepis.1